MSWLRGLVSFLMDEGLTTTKTLTQWAHRADFRRDWEGRAKYLGIAAFQWLRMRLGVDTVKPDVTSATSWSRLWDTLSATWS